MEEIKNLFLGKMERLFTGTDWRRVFGFALVFASVELAARLDLRSVWDDDGEVVEVENILFFDLGYLGEASGGSKTAFALVLGGWGIMRFYLCGGLDAPDWILPNIVTLSTIPSTRVKVLVEYIIQRIAEGTFDYENALKITTDASLGISDAKACIAALHFMVSNAAKFDVEDSTLTRELQQLGLPKEHTDVVVRPYWERKEVLRTKLLQESLQLPSLEVKAWQVQSGDTKNVVMRLKSSANDTELEMDESEDFVVCMTAEKFRVLHHELKTARALMDAHI